jgi:hypothetical protein
MPLPALLNLFGGDTIALHRDRKRQKATESDSTLLELMIPPQIGWVV